jgi:hypothetical protein
MALDTLTRPVQSAIRGETMRSIQTAAALVAAFALFGCGQTAAPQATFAAADSTTAPVPEGTPTSAQLVGSWGDNGDCNLTTTINADGAFTNYTGNAGTWTLEGDLLTLTSPAGTAQVRVNMPNENQLFIGQPDGSFGISQRC